MARTGSTRIARNPGGRDFLIPVRDGYAAHSFYGGNAFMLDLLRVHRDELEVTAGAEELARAAAATRRQLGEQTARVTIEGLERTAEQIAFAVRVENLTGHKFPTGYPSRRAWLHVQVRDAGDQILFESGGFDREGRLLGLRPELGIAHASIVESPADVPIYELVAQDPDGKPTTSLVHMVGRLKDTRLLPRGWRRDGPHAAETAPVGTGNDLDFVAGGDTVGYRIALPPTSNGQLRVIAWLHYQTIPPAWADALRAEPGAAAQRFLRLYDGAAHDPETVAVTSTFAAPPERR